MQLLVPACFFTLLSAEKVMSTKYCIIFVSTASDFYNDYLLIMDKQIFSKLFHVLVNLQSGRFAD